MALMKAGKPAGARSTLLLEHKLPSGQTPTVGMEWSMAANTTLNAKNLEALGAGRLAALLIEISAGDAAAKRRLRLELAGAQSPAALAREVRKRLATIGRSRGFVGWDKTRTLVADLENQRRLIVESVAKTDLREALELLWRFMELAESVFARCDDSNGAVGDVFRAACRDFGPLAEAARPDPVALADRAFGVLQDNGYGQFDDLIEALAPALGAKGLDRLRARFIELSKMPVATPPQAERRTIGYGSGGPMYEDDIQQSGRESAIRLALMAIADAQGDVDAFMAQYDARTRKVPKIAAKISVRLLAAGRTDEALALLDAAEHGRRGEFGFPDFAWDDARIEVLEALDRKAEAQDMRWSCFERALSADHLRAWLRRLPDFDDVEAEDKALAFARHFENPHRALCFLIDWPALEHAAELVAMRAREIDGNRYEVLTPAANALAGKHPLAATLLLRAMIDFTLTKARSSRYKHAARHFLECASLAGQIEDFGTAETHDAWAARLRRERGKKTGFWGLVC